MNALDDETVNECDNYFSIYECGGKSAIHRTSKRAQHQTLSGKYPCSKKKYCDMSQNVTHYAQYLQFLIVHINV